MIYAFENCELDPARVILRRDGSAVRVEPQVFDLLRCLLERRGEVVHKEELLDSVWGNRFVSDSALTTRIRSARQAVGDDGSSQRVIRTVHGRGYEFVADVRILEGGRPSDRGTGPVRPPTTIGTVPARAIPPRTIPSGFSPTAIGQIPTAADPATLDTAPLDQAKAGGGTPTSISRLPAAVQALIGRDDLLERLVEVLAAHRLVTLAGPGGVGKTTVGFELARLVEPGYVDGVSVVELVSVIDEGATFEAFATALDVNTRQQTSVEDAIVDMLRPRHALLLLDNCEHLVEPLASLVNRILRAAPRVSILATSREPLAVAGEQVWTVEPLPVAEEEGLTHEELAAIPAVALFVERARAADPAFQLDATTAPAVIEICRRLDGIPLAIELAAARARAIDVTEIARRLDERFRLLKGVRRGADPRHRTLHDAISWSYDMLGHHERRLFAALAVFAGQFDLDAAESICAASGATDGSGAASGSGDGSGAASGPGHGSAAVTDWGDGRGTTSGPGDDVLDLLTRLTERSMLAVRRAPSGGTRYELLETLREYGRRRLDDQRRTELFAAHAAHFAAVTRSIEADLRTPREQVAVARADASFADLRAAQRFALQVDDIDTAYELITAIREYSMRTMRYEVFAWAEAAARVPGGTDHPLHPLVTGIQAYGAWVRGEYDSALALAHAIRSVEEARALVPSGLVERVLANVLYVLGDIDAGMAEAARQMDLAEASGSASRVVHACYMASVAASSIGVYDEAERLAARAREAASRTGSPTDLASACVAEAFAVNDDDVAALAAFAGADEVARSAGNRWMSAFARTEASGLLVHHGDLVAGCEGLAEMVDTWYRAGDWSQQWHTLSRCVFALDRIGQPELAVEVVGAVEAHATMGSPPVMGTLRDLTFGTRESLRDRLGAARTEELCAVGASRPIADVVHRTRNALLGRPLGS